MRIVEFPIRSPKLQDPQSQIRYRNGAHSSAGQSYRLITGWSLVRIQVGPSIPTAVENQPCSR